MALVRDNQARTVQRWLERHDAGSAKPPPMSTEAFGLDETGFFTSFYTKCVSGLRILSQQSSKKEGVDHKSRRCLRQSCEKLLLLEDAFSSGKIESSLDNHEHLRKAIARSLYEIGKRIIRDLDAIQESSGKYSHAELVSDLENYIEQAKYVVAQDASDTDSTGSLSSNEDDVRQKTLRAGRRLGTLEVQLVARHVDLLLQLCPSIEQVYENKHRTQHSGFRDVPVLHVTKASDSYASAVQAKFPWADPSLVQRLGEANWERHERLRNLEKTAPDSVEQLLAQDLPPPKSQFQPVSLFRDSALGSSIAPRSQSAASAASHSSFASSKDGAERGRLRVPNMPKGNFGEPFECPFCKKLLSSIRSRVDWKMHVFADLQSYICVHNDCLDILTTFPSRKAWFEHETSCHLSRHKICCPQCDTSYEKENDFLDHCERQHDMSLRNPQLRSSALANAIVSYLEKPSSIQCALCSRRGFASLRDYSTHLGRELEEVSLYPLPDLDDSDEENEDDSENESSSREITLDIARTTPSTHSSSSFSEDNGEKNAEGQDYPLDSNSQLEEEYTIKCICGFTSDDGNTVYCEKCDTWQHIQCYYITTKRVPQAHYCSDCVPNNKVDAKRAHERQLRLREAPLVQDMGPAPPRAAPKDSSRVTATSSYWSTLEKQHFPALVGYYGRDFSAIATHLGTKTSLMVSNYYFREVEVGNTSLRKLAKAAERRRDAGEPLGMPPDPLPPRRPLKLPIDANKGKGKKAEATTSEFDLPEI
ncbi:hypothetical protein GJ744_006955 [Endocarpon pusillum]|uniref:Uncharacterized protein n=1 Tax=Endocarpon pusillum TaxID=364733 RepID=A0A8H7AMS3_9EURO|nr:hypothetical protein GJ744_006955 [Endocarpon pusillum]